MLQVTSIWQKMSVSRQKELDKVQEERCMDTTYVTAALRLTLKTFYYSYLVFSLFEWREKESLFHVSAFELAHCTAVSQRRMCVWLCCRESCHPVTVVYYNLSATAVAAKDQS